METYIAYAGRAVGTGVFFGNAVLLAAIAAGQDLDQNLLIVAGLTGIQGALTYLGLGQVSSTLEPDVGLNKEDG